MIDTNELITKIISLEHSMVSRDRFETVVRNKEKIDKLEGDIVECGVWKGGFSIFLAHLFPDRKMWMFDSFEGFESKERGMFKYGGEERHTPSYPEMIKVSIDKVKQNMEEYGLFEGDRIKLIKGFVKDTLPTISTDKISLLRVDVDAYSATLEVLTFLYPKVVSGGMIIFDDSCIRESNDAISRYFIENKISTKIFHPSTDELVELNDMKEHYSMTGGYMFKP